MTWRLPARVNLKPKGRTVTDASHARHGLAAGWLVCRQDFPVCLCVCTCGHESSFMHAWTCVAIERDSIPGDVHIDSNASSYLFVHYCFVCRTCSVPHNKQLVWMRQSSCKGDHVWSQVHANKTLFLCVLFCVLAGHAVCATAASERHKCRDSHVPDPGMWASGLA